MQPVGPRADGPGVPPRAAQPRATAPPANPEKAATFASTRCGQPASACTSTRPTLCTGAVVLPAATNSAAIAMTGD